jgi:hypothetical protein
MTLDTLIERLTALRREGAPGNTLVILETEDDTWDPEHVELEPTCVDDEVVVRIYTGESWSTQCGELINDSLVVIQ